LVSYPSLSEQQQKLLPKLKQAAIVLPILFEDSTHQLWRCDTVDGPMILKVCNQESVKRSAFWQGLNHLFSAGFPASLQYIATVSQQISAISSLRVAGTVAAQANSFVLAKWLEGDTIEPGSVTDRMVILLAEHLGQLHQHTKETWGEFHQPSLSVEQWPIRLHDVIETLAESHRNAIPENILNLALQQAKTVHINEFVPIMPDLRWDQFLQQNGELSALVDLDAFVIGPRELELVLLEYILTVQQAEQFKRQYQQYQMIPDLSDVRTAYRLLLFLMNVLGESSLKNWLEVPAKF
jgi:aminoglycoside phosphotransferase (APT) family kinase protein